MYKYTSIHNHHILLCYISIRFHIDGENSFGLISTFFIQISTEDVKKDDILFYIGLKGLEKSGFQMVFFFSRPSAKGLPKR